ncbi:hypothetical protein [Mycobacteroides chelonae]|nr:hypothetical protein [Mycobacteroides chelonae]
MSDEFDEVDPEWCEWSGYFLETMPRHPWVIYREDYDDIVEVPCPE